MLAFWARQCGSKLALNEIHVLRRDALHALFPDVRVSMHDGELIDVVLDTAICPDTVLINPPYSVGLERSIPVDCISARHAKGVLATRVNKSDVHDAEGLTNQMSGLRTIAAIADYNCSAKKCLSMNSA
jgi:hypothetical protein